MPSRQDVRQNGDLRHRNRDQRLQKLLAAKPKPKAKIVDEAGAETALVVGLGPGLCLIPAAGPGDGKPRHVRCDLLAVPGDTVSILNEKVIAIAPRRSILSRTDPANANRDRLIAANLDVMVIVAAVANPPIRPGLVDRYLIAAARAGIQPVLCLNKIDLEAEAEAPVLWQIPTVRCSTKTGRGIDELRTLLAGSLSVLVGHSGVGKSSLLNALAGEDRARTGEVSEETGKGRHTTSWSRLYVLGNGARIIDTAGIREFGVGRLSVEELRGAFPEFQAQGCRFADCTHIHEPDCPVRAGGGPRYASYRRLAAEL